MKVQHLKRNNGNQTVCSGSYIHALDDATPESLRRAVNACRGRQGFLIVGHDQTHARAALRVIARGQQSDGQKYKVKRVGKWSSEATMYLVNTNRYYV